VRYKRHVVDEHAVVVDRLRVVRCSRVALDGISVAVARGVVTGLLGPSRSGKSTLIRAVVGVQRIEAGEVTVLGEPAGSPPLRRQVALVTLLALVLAAATLRRCTD
jgi:ABC-2 type transport system ATP-binding protein